MKRIIVCFICFAFFSTVSCYHSTVNAERVYCSTSDKGFDFFIETDELSGTRSGLTYVGVYTNRGDHSTWCFQYWTGEYMYQNWLGGMNSSNQPSPWRYLKDYPLANDILYVTLKEKTKLRGE